MNVGLMLPSERAWVASSWLRSYEHAEVTARAIQRGAYRRHFGSLVDALLDAGKTYVARNPKDETHALAWCCRARDKNTLHYVYVKWLLRDSKRESEPLALAAKVIGESGLHAERGLRVTFSTAAWLRWAAKHGVQFEHDRDLVAATRAAARRSPQKEGTSHG